MATEQLILRRDLLILEQMASELPAYLRSNSTGWVMAKGDMPRLTIGGCLMRVHRLATVRDLLTEAQQKRYEGAAVVVDQVLRNQVARFELRAHRELHTRLSEWIGSLRNWSEGEVASWKEYANKVDTRVVIEATVHRLSETPFRLDPQIPEEIGAVDQHLRGSWDDGAFVWPLVWQRAYPRTTYWWLYGRLKSKVDAREFFDRVIPMFTPGR